MGMKTYLHGTVVFVRTLKPRFRAGGLDLPGKKESGEIVRGGGE